jgi:hypothetical protein
MSELAPMYLRKNTFPGEGFLRQAAGTGGLSRRPVPAVAVRGP